MPPHGQNTHCFKRAPTIINVFAVTFEQFDVSWLNKTIKINQSNKQLITDPKLLNCTVYTIGLYQ